MGLQRISKFCDRHGIYMENRFDVKMGMYSFYFEKNKVSYIKLVGRENVDSDDGESIISGLRRKYGIPKEKGEQLDGLL